MALGIAFDGRLSREGYVRAQVGVGVGPMVLLILLAPVIWFVSAVLRFGDAGSGILALIVVGGLVTLSVVTTLGNEVRRAHDLDIGARWVALAAASQAVALACFVASLWMRSPFALAGFLAFSLGPAWFGFQLRFKSGDRRPNRFGEAPTAADPAGADFQPVKRRDLDAELRETRRALDKAESDLKR